VTATLPGQTVAAQLGTIQLATFVNPGGLNSIGSSLMVPTDSSGNAITDTPGGTSGMGTLEQGGLENSNVDVVAEFVQMILAQRAYESNSKVVHVADDMYSQINGMIR
jgi:flagellar basal-body rod protein FlgG